MLVKVAVFGYPLPPGLYLVNFVYAPGTYVGEQYLQVHGVFVSQNARVFPFR